jgi:hypothetical protein
VKGEKGDGSLAADPTSSSSARLWREPPFHPGSTPRSQTPFPVARRFHAKQARVRSAGPLPHERLPVYALHYSRTLYACQPQPAVNPQRVDLPEQLTRWRPSAPPAADQAPV